MKTKKGKISKKTKRGNISKKTKRRNISKKKSDGKVSGLIVFFLLLLILDLIWSGEYFRRAYKSENAERGKYFQIIRELVEKNVRDKEGVFRIQEKIKHILTIEDLGKIQKEMEDLFIYIDNLRNSDNIKNKLTNKPITPKVKKNNDNFVLIRLGFPSLFFYF
ncbi:MAG: hypothetical protein PHE43_02270 [Candidatus Nanoarchaeia archaeon]|nr:hypothetical protein [Candidatus Nanoarchaeia archaeon]